MTLARRFARAGLAPTILESAPATAGLASPASIGSFT
jgi:hypothetical protein